MIRQLMGLALSVGTALGCNAAPVPMSAIATNGDFKLEIDSAQDRYEAGQPLEVSATLTYTGSADSVRITHGYDTPLGFGIVEPINGLHLDPGWRLSCQLGTLERDVGFSQAFIKSGGFSGPNPSFEAFFADPALRLPAGTWHIYAVAEFGEDDSCPTSHYLRADLTVEVR